MAYVRPHATRLVRRLAAFADAFKPKRMLLIGGDGIPVEEFLSRPVDHWVL